MSQVKLSHRKTVRDFAAISGIPIVKLAKAVKKLKLMPKGQGLKKHTMGLLTLNLEAQELLCMHFDKDGVVPEVAATEEEVIEDVDDGVRRAPIICVMGHVDHGKTSLLDYLRKTQLAAREAGGITQSIGAFSVKSEEGAGGVYLDTPGHAAFHNMRARGASLTDIVVLIVAADRGVQPQTIESIKLALKSECPIIVAINKCDLEHSDPDKVEKDLLTHGIATEEYGGDVTAVRISAKTGMGVDELQASIDLTAECMDLRTSIDCRARAVVIETKIDKAGCVVNCIVTKGTLKQGDFVVCGSEYTRVKAITDEKKKRVKEAGPSSVVSVVGFNTASLDLPEIHVVKNEQTAKEMTGRYSEHKGYEMENDDKNETIEVSSRFNQMKRDPSLRYYQRTPALQFEDTTGTHYMRLLIKADVKGALDALMGYINLLPQDQVKLFVVKNGIGPVTENDIDLAHKLGARVFAFNINVSKSITALAKNRDVPLIADRIIYNLMDAVQEYGQSVMPYTLEPAVVGNAQVNQVFTLNGKQKQQFTSAGCTIKSGVIYKRLEKSLKAEEVACRVVRDKTVLFQGAINTLFHFKDTVNSVKAGQDCSITLAGFDRFNKDDMIECLAMQRQQSNFDDSNARQPDHSYLDD